MRSILIIAAVLLGFSSAQAKEISMLFVGNSHTYIPVAGTPEDPAIPKMVAAIAQSIDPSLEVKFAHSTPGGYRLEQHFNNKTSVELLRGRYDKVVVQANSIEPLDLPPWFLTTEDIGVSSFSVYLPKILDLAFEQNTDVTLYVTWGWHPKHSYFEPTHPGLYFPSGSVKAGTRWCGGDKYEYQRMLNKSWLKYSQSYPTKFAFVGDAWLSLQDANVVEEEDLYVPNDWSHASLIGAYAAALMLVKESLGLDISKSLYIPAGVDAQLAARIRRHLAVRQ